MPTQSSSEMKLYNIMILFSLAQPWAVQLEARAKYDAWAKVKGKSPLIHIPINAIIASDAPIKLLFSFTTCTQRMVRSTAHSQRIRSVPGPGTCSVHRHRQQDHRQVRRIRLCFVTCEQLKFKPATKFFQTSPEMSEVYGKAGSHAQTPAMYTNHN